MAKAKGLKYDGIDVLKWVTQLRMIRDEIDEIEEKHKAELAQPRRVFEQLSGQLLEYLDSTGQESAKTAAGTVFVSVRPSAAVVDADEFFDFVIAHGAFELVERRACATACRDFAVDQGHLPPGVKLNTTRTARVRTAT